MKLEDQTARPPLLVEIERKLDRIRYAALSIKTVLNTQHVHREQPPPLDLAEGKELRAIEQTRFQRVACSPAEHRRSEKPPYAMPKAKVHHHILLPIPRST